MHVPSRPAYIPDKITTELIFALVFVCAGDIPWQPPMLLVLAHVAIAFRPADVQPRRLTERPSSSINMLVPPPRRAQLTRNAGVFSEQFEDSLYPDPSSLSPVQVIRQLSEGNKMYVESRQEAQPPSRQSVSSLSTNTQAPVQAVVISCARSYAPIDSVFQAAAGDLTHIRVCGNACSPGDGVVGSVEFSIQKAKPPVLMVLGNNRCDVVSEAVRFALDAASKTVDDMPPATKYANGLSLKDMRLIEMVSPSAIDALSQKPEASFEQLCELTMRLNVFRSIESLLTTSRLIAEGVIEGVIEVRSLIDTVDRAQADHACLPACRCTAPSSTSPLAKWRCSVRRSRRNASPQHGAPSPLSTTNSQAPPPLSGQVSTLRRRS